MPAISPLLNKFFLKYQNEPYQPSNVDVKFEFEHENDLHVFITTSHLEMDSITWSNKDFYQSMCGHKETMELYGLGIKWDETLTTQRLSAWINLWQQNIPFSGFSVHIKNSDEYVGHVALDCDETTPAGAAEISYIFAKDYWGRGYASEAVWPVVNTYSDEIIKRKYLVQGEPYSGVYATARPDNPGSIVVLLKAGLDIKQEDGIPFESKWGSRFSFFKHLDQKAETLAVQLPNAKRLSLAS